MILNIIMFKNMKVNAFTSPQFIDIEPEKAAVQLARSMKVNPEKAHPYQNLVMYYMGTFDDETGNFGLNEAPYQLLDCRTIWKGLKDELLSKTEEHGKTSEDSCN